MRFEEAYEGWNEGRLTQAEAARSSEVCNSPQKWHYHFRRPQKLCSAYSSINPCRAAYFLPLSAIRFKTSHNRGLCIIGHSRH